MIFAAPRKLSLLLVGVYIKICTTTPSTTTRIVNVNVDFIIIDYFHLVVTL